MKEVTLTITLEEANLILDGLGGMPFSKVYQLIGKIQQQANHQLSPNGEESQEMPIIGEQLEPKTS